ncbi:MAG: hypothetical protein EZS26_000103 [Candidatus Ordinivivax streblomastigis]|uniref:Histidine kinase/HSP90-like ATPase domain-containing protein n=1 Tax=Candidatus Ordinivivax streblomastigis TaxID=2540710 RepID=A0A5M8P5G9_9BACT|nr:MAG: hypothetical protein EZS26_000103 [Candidatus Ordinivivax streblomastigis]
MMKQITLDTIDTEYWIRAVADLCDTYGTTKQEQQQLVSIILTRNIQKSNMSAVHLVLFACLIEYLDRLNYNIEANIEDEDLYHFLFHDLNFSSYFSNEKKTEHYDSPKKNILNLWKIESGREKGYSISVTEYFKRNYFLNCDLTLFQSSLDELYINVADHAEANGIAFSYIDYNEEDGVIHIAVCDFGLGIPTTLRKYYSNKYTNDTDALKDSLKIGVSARTNTHNRGFGLDNVVSNLQGNDILQIISNQAKLICHAKQNQVKIDSLDFEFKGTLIYFDIGIDAFQSDEETLFDIAIG